MFLPEFAWMAEKTTALARASCSTKEYIRAIDGSVPVKEASNLHADPCRAEMAEIEVAQNVLCSTAPPGLAKSRQRIEAIEVQPSKFRKNLKYTAGQNPEALESCGLVGHVMQIAKQWNSFYPICELFCQVYWMALWG